MGPFKGTAFLTIFVQIIELVECIPGLHARVGSSAVRGLVKCRGIAAIWPQVSRLSE